MKAKWMIVIGLLAVVGLLLTGCWDSRELRTISIVTAMGVDKAPEKNEYRVSLQIVNPGTVATGSMGGGGGSNVTPATIYSSTGNTLMEAIRHASQKVPRELFFSHTQLLIIGEPLAKQGINEIFEMFYRSHEARLTTRVLVTRGVTAETVVQTLAPLEKIPANSATGKIKNTSKMWSENIEIIIDDVIKALTSEGREPIISGITIVGNQKEGKKLSNNEQTVPPAVIEIKSMALFKDGKLTYWLHGHEGRGVSWIQNKMKSTIININCKDQKDAVGIEVVRSKTEIKVDIRAKRPMFHILIREEGDISEVKCPIDTSKEEEVKKLETEWANETRKEVMQALYAAQRTKSDVFGFGDAVNRAHPRAWESMKNDWNETFADSKADVKVDAFIRRTGMRTKSFLMEQSKQE
ncbi:Ger(x)C family spore germination protein [Paenibacillus darwinianus]|uniref:Ger(x)C family spore germination protein n=1 Tax=Paenibacillus darwinianus TaxID=1380763 RepID=UPI00044E7354|nr:Ger(x)C family spore germination protein [Paenibacillus darwinianus]EXX85931.1 hypothetical protein CH50_08315 [Paenibacillus darwinianus]